MLRSGDHLRPRDFKSFPGKTGHKTLNGRDLPSDGATFPGQHWVKHDIGVRRKTRYEVNRIDEGYFELEDF